MHGVTTHIGFFMAYQNDRQRLPSLLVLILDVMIHMHKGTSSVTVLFLKLEIKFNQEVIKVLDRRIKKKPNKQTKTCQREVEALLFYDIILLLFFFYSFDYSFSILFAEHLFVSHKSSFLQFITKVSVLGVQFFPFYSHLQKKSFPCVLFYDSYSHHYIANSNA